MLKIDGVWKTFGGITALMDVSFNVEKQEIKAVIGPNGAGKTTLFNVISGVYKPDRGNIYFNEKKINNLGPVKIARLGISRTFQNVELYRNMTVLENVMVGRYAKTKSGFFGCGFRLPSMAKEERQIKKISEELLEYVGLYEKKDYLAGELPIGSQRILEIARALATEPTLIMFDEPASGLNDAETKALSAFIKRLRDEKALTIVLVEHDMGLVMDISDNIVVLNFGEKLAEGTPEEIRNNKLVIDAYLGEEELI
ncbi:MAG: ABC transporter ATP-binding protein [Proteobacteria bacterium]|nr:ABC transporter ATP-binding protein [Pseudomonadota bacterium]